jgi:hypothetical protein
MWPLAAEAREGRRVAHREVQAGGAVGAREHDAVLVDAGALQAVEDRVDTDLRAAPPRRIAPATGIT